VTTEAARRGVLSVAGPVLLVDDDEAERTVGNQREVVRADHDGTALSIERASRGKEGHTWPVPDSRSWDESPASPAILRATVVGSLHGHGQSELANQRCEVCRKQAPHGLTRIPPPLSSASCVLALHNCRELDQRPARHPTVESPASVFGFQRQVESSATRSPSDWFAPAWMMKHGRLRRVLASKPPLS
jgi:hypothetical protein